MNLWNIGAGIVEFVLTVGLSLVIMAVVLQKWIGPRLVSEIAEELQEQFKTAEDATKQGMSAMGKKSATMHQVQAIEGLVSEGILANYPELEMLMESMNPELYDKIMEKLKENPELIHILYERWGPVLERRRGADPRVRDERKYPRL